MDVKAFLSIKNIDWNQAISLLNKNPLITLINITHNLPIDIQYTWNIIHSAFSKPKQSLTYTFSK